ncbi:MAG: response regulator [Acidobacteria bacterium]|nr:response regulator [Acidobacteriota bacterium]
MEHPFASGDAGVRDASILIVEDDPGAVEAFEQMLKAEGCLIRVTLDAESALVEIARAAPAAILLDLHLPVIDGLELLRRLRATSRHAHIPVAVVTGDYLVEDRVARELEVLGARIYFKPLWEEDLIRIVRDLLSAGGYST